ncbi:MAG: hypothetical protein M0Q23_02120 [Syntrophales bacterium]|nr:hypothetical protein [Syntrophales bacterium]
MIRGASGSGKSRCALELIRRGHQLVADDLVCVRRRGRGRLRGSSHQGIKGLIEVRGRGIVNVCEQFEASVVSGSSPVDLVFDLTGMPGRQGIGAEPCSRFRLLGRDLPVFRWSGSSGDDPADSVERVAADRRVWAGAVL